MTGLLAEALLFHPWPHEYRLRVLPQRDDYRSWLTTFDPHALRWVRVIRDPYKRAVSSYRHALGAGYEDLEIERTLGLRVVDRGLSFAEFLDHLTQIDIRNCNEHHREQWNPIERWVRPTLVVNADREPLLDKLVEFVAPDPAERQVMAAEVEKVSAHHHAHRSGEKGEYGGVVFQRSSARAPWPEYEAFLNADSRRKIERIFNKDFEEYASDL